MLRPYLTGLSLSNRRIAQELDLGVSDVRAVTEALQHGLAARLLPAPPEGGVETDKVCVVADHEGNPAAVAEGVPADAGG